MKTRYVALFLHYLQKNEKTAPNGAWDSARDEGQNGVQVGVRDEIPIALSRNSDACEMKHSIIRSGSQIAYTTEIR